MILHSDKGENYIVRVYHVPDHKLYGTKEVLLAVYDTERMADPT